MLTVPIPALLIESVSEKVPIDLLILRDVDGFLPIEKRMPTKTDEISIAIYSMIP